MSPTNKTLTFTTPERTAIRTKIVLDGEELWALQPKTALLVDLIKEINFEDEEDPRNAKALEDFLNLCMEPEAAARLRERMADPADSFDLDTLVVVMEGLQEVWAERPTPPGAESSAPRRQRASGKRSTVPVRSVG